MKILGCFLLGWIGFILLCGALHYSQTAQVAMSAMPRRMWTCLSWLVILSLAVAAYAVLS